METKDEIQKKIGGRDWFAMLEVEEERETVCKKDEEMDLQQDNRDNEKNEEHKQD